MQEKLGILKDILGGFQRSGKEYFFHCPNPKCDPDKKKLSINLDKDMFHCWLCDWSGRSLYRIVKQYGKDSHKFKWKSLENFVDISSFEEKLFGTKQTVEKVEIKLPKDFISLTPRKRWDSKLSPVKYLKSRGITYQDVLDWRLGYSPGDSEYGERIIIPSFDLNGNLNYFVGRTYVDDYYKYKNPNTSKNIIFNHLHIDWDEDIILIEGPFDAFKSGTNSIPLLGSSLKEKSLLFSEIVRHDATIYTALDPDARKKQVDLINKLLEYDIELYEIEVPNDKDVGMLTKEEFKKLKEESKSVDNANRFQYNLLNKFKELKL